MVFAPTRPYLYHLVLPEAEQAPAQFVYDNLRALDGIVNDLSSAVELHVWALQSGRHLVSTDLSRRAEITRLYSWAKIGADAGALSVYGFHRLTQSFNGHLAKCPTLKSKVDRKALKHAWISFRDAFPDFVEVRNGAAHSKELFSTSEKLETHVLTSGFQSPSVKAVPNGKLIIEGAMIDGRVTYTIDGKAVSFAADQGAVDALADVSNQVWDAMEPAIGYVKQLNRERYGAPRQQSQQG